MGIFHKAFEACPPAMEPELSKTNQEHKPVRTAFLISSGALSYKTCHQKP